MREITVKVPDQKLNFFIQLAKELGFEIGEQEEIKETIPQWQQDLTLKRMAELDKDPSKAIDFDDMIDRLEKKHGL